MFTDTEVYVTIGDVSSNDGVPKFLRPELNEIAYVPEVSFYSDRKKPKKPIIKLNCVPNLYCNFGFRKWVVVIVSSIHRVL